MRLRDFFQGGREALGVTGELRAAGVGEILAFAGAGEVEQLRHDGAEDGEEQTDDQDDYLKLVAVLAAARIGAAAATTAEPQGAADDFGEDNDGPEHDGGERHELHVAVLEVAHLVGDDALEFVAVEAIHQAGGDGDGTGFRFAADGEGVGCWIVDQEDARHEAQPGGEPHFIDDVEQLRAVFFFQFARVRASHEDGFGTGEVGDHHATPKEQGKEQAQRAGVGGDQFAAGEADEQKNHRHSDDEDRRTAAIGLNLFPHAGSVATRLEFNLRGLALVLGLDLEELAASEVEHCRDEIRREDFDVRVVGHHRIVVELTGEGHLVFG